MLRTGLWSRGFPGTRDRRGGVCWEGRSSLAVRPRRTAGPEEESGGWGARGWPQGWLCPSVAGTQAPSCPRELLSVLKHHRSPRKAWSLRSEPALLTVR